MGPEGPKNQPEALKNAPPEAVKEIAKTMNDSARAEEMNAEYKAKAQKEMSRGQTSLAQGVDMGKKAGIVVS